MAKQMTKSEALDAVRRLAGKMAATFDRSFEWLETTQWEARRDTARALAAEHEALIIATASVRYKDAAVEAFENAIQAQWANKLKQREVARRNWKRVSTGLDAEQANVRVRELLAAMNIRGAYISGSDISVSRNGERGWHSGPSLSWRFDSNYDRRLANPDQPNQYVTTYQMRLDISTGGRSYSLAEMHVMLKIHQELLDAAAELTTIMDKTNVIRVYPPLEPEVPDGAKEPVEDARQEG